MKTFRSAHFSSIHSFSVSGRWPSFLRSTLFPFLADHPHFSDPPSHHFSSHSDLYSSDPHSHYFLWCFFIIIIIIIIYNFSWTMTVNCGIILFYFFLDLVDCGIFISLIMSIGCSWFVEWVAKIWCGYCGFGYKFDVKIVVVVRVG